MIVRYTNHLVIRFKYEPALDSSLPDSLSLPGLKKEGGPGDGAKTSKPAPDGPAKSRKPIELQANSVTAYVTTQGSKKELQYLVCEGTVHVHQEGETPKDKGVDITGELLNLDRHPKGDTLKVFGDSRTPGQLQLGELFLIGPKVTINQKDNVAEVDGAGAMNMPSNRTFDGGKTAKEGARLTVHWSQNMFFNGKDAYFDTSTSKDAPGGVLAYQDTASMKCQNLQVTLDKTVSFKEGQKENQGAKVEKLVCDRKVYIEDKVKGPGEKILKFDRLEATWLTMDNQDGPTIARGPNGRVTRLAPGSSEGPLAPPGPPPMPGAKDAKDLKNAKHPKENQRLMKTQVDFDGYMFSNTKDNSRNAKFYDNVEVKHWPSEDPDAVMDPDNPPKDGFFMRCELLNVFTRQIEGKTYQMMRAERKVFFRSKEFFGRSDVMKYDEAQDQVIFEGINGNHATLYKKKPDGTYEEIKGSKILYNRKTGVFQLEGGRVITSWLFSPGPSLVLAHLTTRSFTDSNVNAKIKPQFPNALQRPYLPRSYHATHA